MKKLRWGIMGCAQIAAKGVYSGRSVFGHP